jgi:hypothetical protein
MNWDAVAAIAELTGALAVVLSLIYLGKQIKSSLKIMEQNIKAMQSASESSSMAQTLEMFKTQIESREIAELISKGHRNFDELDFVDKYRYSLFLQAIFEVHQTYHAQTQRGGAGLEIWGYYSRVFDNLCRVPAVVRWWKQNRDVFDPSFAEYIDGLMSEKS